MTVNFFKASCQLSLNDKRFGLTDFEDGTPAKIEITNEERWNATVINGEAKQITFTAIDNCIDLLRPNGEMDARCDGMICSDENLFFIELKNKRESWQTEGLSQIESTIKRFIEENEEYYFGFKKRKAIVSNSRHQFPGFQELNLEQREHFMKTYKARIQFEAEIKIS